MNKHKYSYEWLLKEASFTKDKGKVFSCFACGGGSTMGYKLAGFDVVGCNEIDPKMMECYITNHHPKYSFLEPIQEFKNKELPAELFELDILDGSPPCSLFSMTGNREKDWGKKKKFREGQVEQVLDTLFFDFIDLTKRLQPKVVIAENVKGLLAGNAKQYLYKILKEFDKAGYYISYKLLDASFMGVPQKRQRVFFYGLRKDLMNEKIGFSDLFETEPSLNLTFDEDVIPFKKIEDKNDLSTKNNSVTSTFWNKTKQGTSFSTVHPKGFFFNENKTHPEKALKTICGDPHHGSWHYNIKRLLNKKELCLGGTFPLDYDFLTIKPKYLIGMSVPPVMIAQIADRIYNQWLIKL